MIRMDKRYVIWLAPGVVAFTLALTGCQKKEVPVPAADSAPAGNASAGAGAVAPSSAGSDTAPGGSAATGESRKAEK